jgi:hypothetical protein
MHRNSFYEGFIRPYKVLEQVSNDIKRNRSPDQLVRCFRLAAEAKAAIENYNAKYLKNTKITIKDEGYK